MNRIDLLETRKAKLLSAGKSIRDKISSLCDEGSFVEYDCYSFSKNEFYGEDAEGEGVITGYATLADNPVYIVAQNAEVLSGGISLSGCEKIVKCLRKAEKTATPVIYLLNSLGVQAGEGVSALEGLAGVLDAMSDLQGNCSQISIVLGDLFGTCALMTACCDYTIMLKDGCASYASPLVISAKSGQNLPKDEIGGVKSQSKTNLVTFSAKDVTEARELIAQVFDYVNYPENDNDDDLNRETPALNDKIDLKSLTDATFDNGKYLELGKGFADEVKTVLGRIGGISVAGLIFDGGENGVELNYNNVIKIKEFLYYVSDNELPLVTFVNTLGLETNLNTNNSPVLKELNNLICALKQTERISVIYGKAIGLGYTLFASKSLGNEYAIALANANVGLFDGKVGASVEFSGLKQADLDKLAEKYSNENNDPINTAKNGFIDNIIQPRHVRQHIISALMTL